MDRPLARRLLIAALLIGAGLVVFGRLTLDPTTILVGPQRGGLNDLTDYFLPQTEYKILAWRKHGSLPSWDPHLQLGRPIVGNPQSALYYPATWLMLLTGQARLASWLLVAHHIFAGWGMYLLCRRYSFARPAAIVGGITFLAAPAFVAHTAEGHMTMTWAAAWIPWALLAYERLRRGRPYAVALLAGVLALAFFAGHAQTVYYLVLTLIGFTLCDIVRGLIAQRSGENETDHVKASTVPPVTLATNFALAGLLTAGLVAIDLLPIWLTSQQTTRVQQRLSATDAGSMGATTANLKQLAYPFAVGRPGDTRSGLANYWETLLYVGSLSLLLAIVGVVTSRFRFPTCRYVALFVIAVVFSLGATTPFYALVHNYLPGAATFRVPSRAMLLASAAIAVLAASGLHQLVVWSTTPTASLALRRVLVAATTLLSLAIGAELAWHANAITRVMDASRLRTQSKLTEQWTNSAAEYRVLASQDLLSDEEAFRHGIARVRGYDPFLLVRYVAMLQALLGERQFLTGEAPGYTTEANLQYNRAVLQMLGVKYAALAPPAEQLAPGWQIAPFRATNLLRLHPTPSDDFAPIDTAVYENEQSLPRAFVIGRTVEGRDLSVIDPTTTLLIPANAPPGDERQPLTPAKIVTYEPARVVIEAELVAPGYVVLSDVQALGWKATVNGQRAPIVPVNIALRGVPLAAGKHRIEMKFSPPLWTQGFAVSLIALAIVAYLAIKETRAIKSAAGDGKAGA